MPNSDNAKRISFVAFEDEVAGGWESAGYPFDREIGTVSPQP
jgi:hypothetical protein